MGTTEPQCKGNPIRVGEGDSGTGPWNGGNLGVGVDGGMAGQDSRNRKGRREVIKVGRPGVNSLLSIVKLAGHTT